MTFLRLKEWYPNLEMISAALKAIHECEYHDVLSLKVCNKHDNIYLFSIYCNPDVDDSLYDCPLTRMAAIQENDKKALFLFAGEFNDHHTEQLNSVSPIDCQGLRALDFFSRSRCDQIIHSPTYRSNFY